MSKISKLGLGIVAFDDTCHLKNIITEIRELCDHVTICLQEESYYGEPIDQSVVDYVEILKNEGLVDSIIWFNVVKKYEDEEATEIIPRLIETDKRNFILDYLENEIGCSHSHIIDSDEFYDHDDYANAKKVINDVDNIHVTYCQYVNYYRDYTHIMVWPFLCYVPFISESKYRYDLKNGSFDKPSDPTRRYRMDEDGAQYCILSFKTIKMHHLSWIRKNILDKINNWSSKMYFENQDGLLDRIIDRYNNYRDGQNAVLMFGTPNGEVVVTKLPCAYINPKFSLFDS